MPRLIALAALLILGSIALSCSGETTTTELPPAVTPSPGQPGAPQPSPTLAPVSTPSASGVLPDGLGERYGGTLVLANRGDPPAGFDTLRTSSIALHHIAGALFGPGNLVMRCRENMYVICPYLATKWVASPGFTQWTFTIRDDVYWHDGTPFTVRRTPSSGSILSTPAAWRETASALRPTSRESWGISKALRRCPTTDCRSPFDIAIPTSLTCLPTPDSG